jgi:hypothetical protein
MTSHKYFDAKEMDQGFRADIVMAALSENKPKVKIFLVRE